MSIKSFKTLVDAIGTGTALLHEYRMCVCVSAAIWVCVGECVMSDEVSVCVYVCVCDMSVCVTVCVWVCGVWCVVCEWNAVRVSECDYVRVSACEWWVSDVCEWVGGREDE